MSFRPSTVVCDHVGRCWVQGEPRNESCHFLRFLEGCKGLGWYSRYTQVWFCGSAAFTFLALLQVLHIGWFFLCHAAHHSGCQNLSLTVSTRFCSLVYHHFFPKRDEMLKKVQWFQPSRKNTHPPGDSKWPFSSLSWRSLSLWKGYLTIPKGVSKNHLATHYFFFNLFSSDCNRLGGSNLQWNRLPQRPWSCQRPLSFLWHRRMSQVPCTCFNARHRRALSNRYAKDFKCSACSSAIFSKSIWNLWLFPTNHCRCICKTAFSSDSNRAHTTPTISQHPPIDGSWYHDMDHQIDAFPNYFEYMNNEQKPVVSII